MSHTLLLHLPTTETWTTDQFLMEAKVGRVNITVCNGCHFAVVCASEAFFHPQSCSDTGMQMLRGCSSKAEDAVKELLDLLRSTACLPSLSLSDPEETIKSKKGGKTYSYYMKS